MYSWKTDIIFQLHISYQSAETALHSLIISSEHYVIFDNLTLEPDSFYDHLENPEKIFSQDNRPLNEQEHHLPEVYFSEKCPLQANDSFSIKIHCSIN